MKPNKDDLLNELCEEPATAVSLRVVVVILVVCVSLMVILSLFSTMPAYGLLGIGILVLVGLYGYARSFSKKSSVVKRDRFGL
ncbi:MAG: hypothetical protein OCD01_06060 [Fibrobacterales bacterium]